MTMNANKLTPFYPIHPGEILKDEIEYRKISQRALARQMGIAYSQLNEILNGKRPVNAELALLFEAALGLDPECCLICRCVTICKWHVLIRKRRTAGTKYVNCVPLFCNLPTFVCTNKKKEDVSKVTLCISGE